MLILYLICLIVFLIPICVLTTTQVIHTIQDILPINNLQYKKNYTNYNHDLAEAYIQRKLWMQCIILLENEIKMNSQTSAHQNLLGLCYLKMHLYESSYYHYTQVLQKDACNLVSLLSIAQIYSMNKQYSKAINTYKKILDIDKHNHIAQKKLNTLKFTNYRDSRI